MTTMVIMHYLCNVAECFRAKKVSDTHGNVTVFTICHMLVCLPLLKWERNQQNITSSYKVRQQSLSKVDLNELNIQ